MPLLVALRFCLVRGICGSLIGPEATGARGRVLLCRPHLTLARLSGNLTADTSDSLRVVRVDAGAADHIRLMPFRSRFPKRNRRYELWPSEGCVKGSAVIAFGCLLAPHSNRGQAPRYRSDVWTETWPRRDWIWSDFPPAAAQSSAGPTEVMRTRFSMAALLAHSFTA